MKKEPSLNTLSRNPSFQTNLSASTRSELPDTISEKNPTLDPCRHASNMAFPWIIWHNSWCVLLYQYCHCKTSRN